MAGISGVILAKNEEGNIYSCIKSLHFCDEVLVIDDNSIDQTAPLAVRCGAKVISHSLRNDFAQQRNFGLKQAKNDWVLFVDADEVVSPKLAREIKKKIKSFRYQGYLIKRDDTWLGKKLTGGEFGQMCLLRLGRKENSKWVRSVHEHWLVDGQVGKLKNVLFHYPHKSVADFVSHINFHSTLHAGEHAKIGQAGSFFRIIIYPAGKFVQNYIIRKGYKDGTHGFVAAVIMSFHSFLAWSTLWSKSYKNQS